MSYKYTLIFVLSGTILQGLRGRRFDTPEPLFIEDNIWMGSHLSSSELGVVMLLTVNVHHLFLEITSEIPSKSWILVFNVVFTQNNTQSMKNDNDLENIKLKQHF